MLPVHWQTAEKSLQPALRDTRMEPGRSSADDATGAWTKSERALIHD